ncbi:MAG: BrnT family toxin [Opitutaceae bacterium]
MSVPFEFDPEKSVRTKADPNRGIDFEEAQLLWLDPNRIEVPLPFAAEPRVAVIGKIGPRIWTAIITPRGENIRIISVRRAHSREEEIYEQG